MHVGDVLTFRGSSFLCCRPEQSTYWNHIDTNSLQTACQAANMLTLIWHTGRNTRVLHKKFKHQSSSGPWEHSLRSVTCAQRDGITEGEMCDSMSWIGAKSRSRKYMAFCSRLRWWTVSLVTFRRRRCTLHPLLIVTVKHFWDWSSV